MKGIVFGAFDLLHAGHINLLKKAYDDCGYLVVGLHIDPSLERSDKNKPIESVFERMFKLKALPFVTSVVCYEREEDIPVILEALDIDIRYLGSDYGNHLKPITGEELVKIKYIKSLPIHTSDIRERIKG